MELVLMFERVLSALKTDERCKGGWHFGSVGRREADEYSDYDIVLLVSDTDFEDFSLVIRQIVADASDEILIYWHENFNNDKIKNYCSIIRLGDSLHQFDIFIVNADYPDDWMCKIHRKGCTADNIFFDRAGETAQYLSIGCDVGHHIPDTLRAIETYWFHVQMIVKYFKREDIFKITKVIHEFLFTAHVDLLLSYYDKLDWGAWETKIKRCVPTDIQAHLLVYFAPADFDALKTAVDKGISLFQIDAEKICMLKEIPYPASSARQIMDYFKKSM